MELATGFDTLAISDYHHHVIIDHPHPHQHPHCHPPAQVNARQQGERPVGLVLPPLGSAVSSGLQYS